MKKYWIDANFAMEDGSLGDFGFPVNADDIFEAAKTAQEVADGIEELNLVIWAITEQEAE